MTAINERKISLKFGPLALNVVGVEEILEGFPCAGLNLDGRMLISRMAGPALDAFVSLVAVGCPAEDDVSGGLTLETLFSLGAATRSLDLSAGAAALFLAMS